MDDNSRIKSHLLQNLSLKKKIYSGLHRQNRCYLTSSLTHRPSISTTLLIKKYALLVVKESLNLE